MHVQAFLGLCRSTTPSLLSDTQAPSGQTDKLTATEGESIGHNACVLCPCVSTFVRFKKFLNLAKMNLYIEGEGVDERKGLRGVIPSPRPVIPPQSPMSITHKLMMQSQKGFGAPFHQNHYVDKFSYFTVVVNKQ